MARGKEGETHSKHKLTQVVVGFGRLSVQGHESGQKDVQVRRFDFLRLMKFCRADFLEYFKQKRINAVGRIESKQIPGKEEKLAS